MPSIAEKLSRKGESADTRQVRLKLGYLSGWALTKVAALLGLAVGLLTIVANLVGWALLTSTGLMHQLDLLAGSIISTGTSTSSSVISSVLTFGTVAGASVVLALLDVIGWTIGGAIVAALYNSSVRPTGGLLVGFTQN